MRWKGRRQSSNVEDRRGAGGFGGMFGGGTRGGRRIRSRRKGGIGSLIVMGIIFLFFGDKLGLSLGDMLSGGLGGGSPQYQAPSQSQSKKSNAQQEEIVSFVKVVMAETEDTWGQLFANAGQRYRAPKLVLFDDRTPTACGTGQAASGPFYCPGDQKVYIDLDFMGELQRMGATGDFALAYVLAHEVGHHVQTLLGVAEYVQNQKRRISKVKGNALQVQMELQADCYAGVWANHTENRRPILENGDIQEGIDAAAAVGDDRISGGRLARKHYTHGSSRERMAWFQRGLKTGDVNACDTFNSRF